MAKELPYFRFTAAEWMNGDISLESTYIRGIFIDICAYYWFKDCSITKAMLKKKYSDSVDAINDLIGLDILKHDEESDFIAINFLNEQYDLLSIKRKARQDAGRKGGKQRASNAKAKPKQNPSYKDKDKDKENNKDNNKDNSKRKNFVPPTLDQVKEYCLFRENNIDPEKFIDHYVSNGWLVGKNKMKDWKAAVRTWEKSGLNKGQVKQQPLSEKKEWKTTWD